MKTYWKSLGCALTQVLEFFKPDALLSDTPTTKSKPLAGHRPTITSATDTIRYTKIPGSGDYSTTPLVLLGISDLQEEIRKIAEKFHQTKDTQLKIVSTPLINQQDYIWQLDDAVRAMQLIMPHIADAHEQATGVDVSSLWQQWLSSLSATAELLMSCKNNNCSCSYVFIIRRKATKLSLEYTLSINAIKVSSKIELS